jgi:hypothetical protein
MPDWLVRQYWREIGTQTDQDYQYILFNTRTV